MRDMARPLSRYKCELPVLVIFIGGWTLVGRATFEADVARPPLAAPRLVMHTQVQALLSVDDISVIEALR